MLISIVATLYRSAPYLREFYRRVGDAAAAISCDAEIIFVDDGSPDDSARLARRVGDGRIPVRVIELSRNYGHHRAIVTGLEHTRGDLVFLVDCDLEERPELLIDMFRTWSAAQSDEDPVDVVYAVPKRRKGGFFERLSGEAFYRAFRFLSGVQVPKNWMIARLMTRRYVQALCSHRERELFLGGLFWITGFRQLGIEDEKLHKGSTTWTLRRKLRAALIALTAFTDRPLWLLALLGSTISLFAAGGIAYLLISRVLFGVIQAAGWASVILSIAFFGGLAVFAIGIVGLYVARVFNEVKQRPCIIKQITEISGETPVRFRVGERRAS
jgi:putative glycosyltransferase